MASRVARRLSVRPRDIINTACATYASRPHPREQPAALASTPHRYAAARTVRAGGAASPASPGPRAAAAALRPAPLPQGRLSASGTGRWLRNRERPRVLCAGCGIGLQSRDTAAAGYIPTLRTLEALEARAAEALEAARRAGSSGGGNSDAAARVLAATASASGLDVATHTFHGHGTVCQRCFQAKHYGKLVPLAVSAAVFRGYLDALARLDALTVLVVDLFDFHGSLIADVAGALAAHAAAPGGGGGGAGAGLDAPPLAPSAAPRDVLLVVNKLDLLPPDVSLPRLETWVRTQWRLAEADARARAASAAAAAASPPSHSSDDLRARRPASARGPLAALPPPPPATSLLGVHLVSAARHFGIRDVARELLAAKRGRDVYVLGAPNVGKSTLINALLAEVWGTARPGALLASGGRPPSPLHAAGGPDGSGDAAATAAADGVRADGSLAMEPPGSSSFSSSTSAAGRRIAAGKPVTLFLDELPEGYRVGDVFTGDVAALAARMRTRDTGAPAGAAAPARGAAPHAELAGGLSAEEVLGLVSARKARHRASKTSSEPAAAAAAAHTAAPRAGGGDAGAALDAALEASLSITSRAATLGASGARETVTLLAGGGPGEAAGGRAASGGGGGGSRAPPVPFTTSPLPGTTLGVIGAALDAHGHAFVYDTPGIVADAFKQRMLEALALSEPAMLAALVPPRRRAFATYRLTPGRCLFLGGLLRLDYLAAADAHAGLLVTVCSHLPVHVSRIERSGELWARHVLGAGSEEPALGAGAAGVRSGEAVSGGDGGGGDGSEEPHEGRHCCNDSVVDGEEPCGDCGSIGDGVDARDADDDGDGCGDDACTIGGSSGAVAAAAMSAAQPGDTLLQPPPAPPPQQLLRPHWGPLSRHSAVRLRDYAPQHAAGVVAAAAARLHARGGAFVWAPSPPRAREAGSDGGAAASDYHADGSYVHQPPPLASDSDASVYSAATELLLPTPAFMGPRDGGSDGFEAEPSGLHADEDGEGGGDLSGGATGGRTPMPPLRNAHTAPGSNAARTQQRRMLRARRALVDLVAPGLGWLAVTPVEIEGTPGWAPAVAAARLRVCASAGIALHARAPLLPYEAAGSRPRDWLE